MTKKSRQRSGKQKKAALKEKRRLKREKCTSTKVNVTHCSPNEPILVKSFGGDIKDKSGPIPSIFKKETREMVEKRRLFGGHPLDILKTNEGIVHAVYRQQLLMPPDSSGMVSNYGYEDT